MRRNLVVLNTWIRDHFVGCLLLVVGVGLVFPAGGLFLKDLRFFPIPGTGWHYDFPNLVLALLLISASTQCDLRDFKQLVARPYVAAVSLLAIYVIVPAIAMGVGFAASRVLPPGIGTQVQVGLLLTALMPVTATSTIWVRLNGGTTSLLLAVIMLTTGLGVVTVPLYLSLLPGLTADSFVVPIGAIVEQLIISVTIPMCVGLALRRWQPDFVQRNGGAFALAGTLGLWGAMFTNVGVAAPHFRTDGQILLVIAALTVALNIAGFWVGIFGARRLGLAQADAVALLFGSGMRSNGTGLVIGLKSFPTMPLVTIPSAAYIISQHMIAAYLTRTLQATNSRFLASPVGRGQTALESQVESLLSARNRRGPGFTVLALELTGANDDADLDALTWKLANAVRGQLRTIDTTFVLPPSRLAFVLRDTSDAGARAVAAKLALFVEQFVLPETRWGRAHSQGFDSSTSLVEKVLAFDEKPDDMQ